MPKKPRPPAPALPLASVPGTLAQRSIITTSDLRQFQYWPGRFEGMI
jgi:hypothetical protein